MKVLSVSRFATGPGSIERPSRFRSAVIPWPVCRLCRHTVCCTCCYLLNCSGLALELLLPCARTTQIVALASRYRIGRPWLLRFGSVDWLDPAACAASRAARRENFPRTSGFASPAFPPCSGSPAGLQRLKGSFLCQPDDPIVRLPPTNRKQSLAPAISSCELLAQQPAHTLGKPWGHLPSPEDGPQPLNGQSLAS